jgi:hypothetical protein
MQIPVEIQREHVPRGPGQAGIALAAAGSLAIGVLKLGIVATLVTTALTLLIGVGGLRLWSVLWRRNSVESGENERDLTASATHGGDVGVLRVHPAVVIWKGPRSEEISYSESHILRAQIRPLPLVGAAELVLSLKDGADVSFTVTAPARSIERALSSPVS